MKKLIFAISLVTLLAGCGTVTTTPPVGNNTSTYTMADIAAANTPAKCWSVINGNVYNLTDWINKHPGGDQNILSICGKDGSSAFDNQHSGQPRPENILAGYQIGILK